MNSASATHLKPAASPRTGEFKHLLPQIVSITNGQYTVQLSNAGSGVSHCEGLAITRWFGDKTRDSDGFYIFLRDLDDCGIWSAGYQPTRAEPLSYSFHFQPGLARIHRVDQDIACELTICVSPNANFEIRYCRLTNLGNRSRRIEITSYLEWVLGNGEADATHPAFSKLFVETQFCGERGAILARRRPRGSNENEFWGFHSVLSDGAKIVGNIQFETNRARFIGRGRTLANPLAMQPDTALSGDFGPVLDPIASLRTVVELAPGESQSVVFTLGGARTREEIDALIAASYAAAVRAEFGEDRLDIGSEANGAPETDGEFATERRQVIVHAPHRLTEYEFKGDASTRRFVPVSATDIAGTSPVQKQWNDLQFDNSYGGFSPDGREYVIRLTPDVRGGLRRPPAPWANVIANELGGCLVSEAGAGYTWFGNSRENRLTAWHNDPICDPHSEAYWIRDEETGAIWSPMPGPTPAEAEYLVRHGFGYTKFEHESHELLQEVTHFVPRDEPVKLTRLRVVNRSPHPRRLSLFSFVHLSLATTLGQSATDVTTMFDSERRTILARNPHRHFYGDFVAFSTVRLDDESFGNDISFTCDRGNFVGQYGDLDLPVALTRSEDLDRRSGNGLDPCAAWQVSIELPSGGTFECTYLLGEATDRASTEAIVNKYSDPMAVSSAFADATQFWRHTLSAIEIETPDRELDLMVNGWLIYQNISCRLWARSAYYQPGGAFGFRDQLQDSAALIFHRPDITRNQIVRNATQQFVEGDVLHWWHPDSGFGLRTRFSDDLLWLPYVTAEYVERTGDAKILDEDLPFLTGPLLTETQHELFFRPQQTGFSESVYEHCSRALDRGLTTGPHGLPLIGTGDWNDGFSHIGWQGRGESVWLGFFIDYTLAHMLPICQQRGDTERVQRYTNYRERLRKALNSAGWDGAWYRRAYYDNGQPIGSQESDECQIDALAQAWAIISGVAPEDKAHMSAEAVEQRLIDDEAGIIRLLTPAFDRTLNDPGYIKGYVPGIRENGGQYTHGVLWMVRAMAELGRGTRAVELLRMIGPVWHSCTTERAEVYKTEPYVVAADIYGESPHVGRGGWTWYTGSAGWMFRVAVESILGLTIEAGHTLVVNPCISRNWNQATLRYRLLDGNTRYVITIENPDKCEHGVASAMVDGKQAEVVNRIARIKIATDGKEHQIVVRLGG